MNTKRILFWLGFVVVIGLIIWGLIAAGNKDLSIPQNYLRGDPSPVGTTDNVLGPADAEVTILEYSDFQCPACEAYSYVLKQLVEDTASSATTSPSVRIVYRHYPLPGHANAKIAAQAAEAAGLQGKFWEFNAALFENQPEWSEETNPKTLFEKYAQELSMDIAKFKTDIESEGVISRVNRDLDEGRQIGIRGTPTFFVNGKLIDNPPSYEAFKQIVRTAAEADSD